MSDAPAPAKKTAGSRGGLPLGACGGKVRFQELHARVETGWGASTPGHLLGAFVESHVGPIDVDASARSLTLPWFVWQYRDTPTWKLLAKVHTADADIGGNRGKIKKGDKYVQYKNKTTGTICQIELTLKDMSAVSGRLRTQNQSKEKTAMKQARKELSHAKKSMASAEDDHGGLETIHKKRKALVKSLHDLDNKEATVLKMQKIHMGQAKGHLQGGMA